MELIKVGVPAFLYLIQNNFQYLAIGLLDPATYSCTYQTKIVWSAILSVLLLGRVLQPHKWAAIASLTLGVCIVQLAGMTNAPLKSVQHESMEAANLGVPPQVIGMILILSAAFASGCAGVYFEKILKGHGSSVWARNLQLASWSVVTGLITLCCSPSSFASVQENGFFHGYTTVTWVVIMMNAFGGLLVGTVIKYANNILKDFAIGCSIVVSSICSVFLFNFQVTLQFLVGMFLVIFAVFLWGRPAASKSLVSPKSRKAAALQRV
jgi:UDP-sugar transporter A1/2/3